MLLTQLTENGAHEKVKDRNFGDLCFPENLFDDERFNEAEFYRWVVTKNKEAKKVLDAKRRV